MCRKLRSWKLYAFSMPLPSSSWCHPSKLPTPRIHRRPGSQSQGQIYRRTETSSWNWHQRMSSCQSQSCMYLHLCLSDGVEMRIPLLNPITSRWSVAGNSKRRSIQSSRALLPHWATVHTRSRTWPISRSASLVSEWTNELPDADRAHWTRYKVITLQGGTARPDQDLCMYLW